MKTSSEFCRRRNASLLHAVLPLIHRFRFPQPAIVTYSNTWLLIDLCAFNFRTVCLSQVKTKVSQRVQVASIRDEV